MGLAGCDTPTRRFRERLTLVVDTPEGTATGSSVIEHQTIFQDGWLGGMASHMRLGGTRGEGVVVDLGTRGLLVGLLFPLPADTIAGRRTGAPGGYEYHVFANLYAQAEADSPRSDDKASAHFIDALNRLKPKGDVPFEILGPFVRFGDPNDPKSVERVEPSNLEASFGPGVRLERATIEITDAPLTTGIEKKLPWLDHYASLNASLDGDTGSARKVIAPLAYQLSSGDFKAGM